MSNCDCLTVASKAFGALADHLGLGLFGFGATSIFSSFLFKIVYMVAGELDALASFSESAVGFTLCILSIGDLLVSRADGGILADRLVASASSEHARGTLAVRVGARDARAAAAVEEARATFIGMGFVGGWGGRATAAGEHALLARRRVGGVGVAGVVALSIAAAGREEAALFASRLGLGCGLVVVTLEKRHDEYV